MPRPFSTRSRSTPMACMAMCKPIRVRACSRACSNTPGRQHYACALIVLARRQCLTFVKRALPSASKSTLPSAPTDLPQASSTNASFTATHATVSTPFSYWTERSAALTEELAACMTRCRTARPCLAEAASPEFAGRLAFLHSTSAGPTFSSWAFSMKPGKCLRLQVGVKAPGTANSTTCTTAMMRHQPQRSAKHAATAAPPGEHS